MFPALSFLNPFGKQRSGTLLPPRSSISPPSPQLSFTAINSCLSHNTTFDAVSLSIMLFQAVLNAAVCQLKNLGSYMAGEKHTAMILGLPFRFITDLQTGSRVLTNLLLPTPHYPHPHSVHPTDNIFISLPSNLKPSTPPSHPISANGLASGSLRTEEKANTLHLSYPPPGAWKPKGLVPFP